MLHANGMDPTAAELVVDGDAGSPVVPEAPSGAQLMLVVFWHLSDSSNSASSEKVISAH